MTYVIEKNVPLPSGSKHFVRSPAVNPLSDVFVRMTPGDSILTDKTLQAISIAAIRCGVNVTSRKEGAAYRVWRTE